MVKCTQFVQSCVTPQLAYKEIRPQTFFALILQPYKNTLSSFVP